MNMSTAFLFPSKEITIYGGISVFVVGIFGAFLNILVFLSLRTFRQSSCGFYLTVMSIVNVGSLFLGVFSRFLTAFLGIDGTETSLFYCKCRLYFSQFFIGTSLTCFCLAIIDQYFATCSRPHWQQWCNIKLAQRITMISIIIWSLHGIPYIVFYNHVLSSTTNQTSCIDTNYIFDEYRGFVVLLGLFGYLPIIVVALFGLMAYRNIQQMAYRTVPLVRRELEKQLTVMVLVQVIVNIFTLLPYTTVSTVAANKVLTTNPAIQAKLQFAVTVTVIFYYITFASPFYIYTCASGRFRRQLIYVLFTIHLSRWRRPRIDINQVVPET